MSMTIGQNVRRMRELKGWSQNDLALKIGVRQPTIDKIEKDITRKSKHLPAIARKFGVTLHKIDESFPQDFGNVNQSEQIDVTPFAKDMIPVYAAAEGGDGAIIVSYEPIDYEKRPSSLAHVKGAYSFYVIGDSMAPRFEPGDRLLINPNLPPKPGSDVVLFRENGDDTEVHALVKRMVKPSPDKWIVKQYNPEKEIVLDRKDWPRCQVIVGVMSV